MTTLYRNNMRPVFDFRTASPDALMLEIMRLSNLEYQGKRNTNILQPSCDNVSNVKRTESRVNFSLRIMTLIAIYICRLKHMCGMTEKRRKAATGRVEKAKIINEKHLRITLMSIKRSSTFQFYMKYLAQKDQEMTQLFEEAEQRRKEKARQNSMKVITNVAIPPAIPEE